MDNKLKNKPKILGLDVSTKTIGFALFDMSDSTLLELTHFSPKIKPQPEDKLEELLKKSIAFEKHLEKYKNIGITRVIIEEPLLNSNNIYTVQTLLRYNTMVCKSIYEIFGLVPTFISTYNARKYAFPDLVGLNDKGKNVLFGGYPKDIDKKHVIWERQFKIKFIVRNSCNFIFKQCNLVFVWWCKVRYWVNKRTIVNCSG